MINFQPISFGSFKKLNKNSMPADSAFFRDYPALQTAVDTVQENFPNGANILDYACSNGEEAASICALLKSRSKDFKITGLDIDENLVEIAKQGIYTISPYSTDSFLLRGRGSLGEEKRLNELFQSIVSECSNDECYSGKDRRSIMGIGETNSNTSYKLRKDAGNITFRQGDLFKINDEKDENVGVICFRNAFYHLMDHYDGEALYNNGVGCLKQTRTYQEKEAIAEEIIEKVHKKLEIGGVFIMGGSLNEWIFIAPEGTDDEDTIRFKDTAQYKIQMDELQNALYYFGNLKDLVGFSTEGSNEKYQCLKKALAALEKTKDVKILKKTPIQKALEKDGNFEPVHFSEVENFAGLRVPTVWIKVK